MNITKITILFLFGLLSYCPLNAQWRVVNRLDSGFEVQSVSEDFKINEEGNYIITVKRYFPNNRNSQGFYEKNHVTNVTTFEIHSSLKNYRMIFDEWLDYKNCRTDYDDCSFSIRRDYNKGWKNMNLNERSSWGNIWREVVKILLSN